MTYAGIGLIVLAITMLLQCSPAPKRPDSTAESPGSAQTDLDSSTMAADSASTVATDSAMMLPPDEPISPPPPPPPPPFDPAPPPPPELPDEYMKNRVALYNDTEQDVIVKIGPSMDELRSYKVMKYDNYVSDEYEISPVMSIRTGNKRPKVSRFVRGNTYHIVWKTASKCFDIE